jgi:rod shape-determining protein MreD
VSVLRTIVIATLVVLAVSLQVGVLANVAISGVVPDLVLLVVVAVALVHGPSPGAAVGLLAGLCWTWRHRRTTQRAAGRSPWWWSATSPDGPRRSDGSAVVTVVAVAACVFIGASVFALTGLVLSDPGVTVERVLDVLVVQVLYDVAVTPLVAPAVASRVAATGAGTGAVGPRMTGRSGRRTASPRVGAGAVGRLVHHADVPVVVPPGRQRRVLPRSGGRQCRP